ncbi:Cdc15p [Rhizophagus irregularis DAOM 197198w]|uniref:Cdc15p n=1 Tax=Rhizophagus irregularis (strain DAOM 197198w) TaxID=1432141 RepID=A0A015LPW1_RHIIW|nr:Cdc15p [Rhizophagus irregularis DAOM 197198w]
MYQSSVEEQEEYGRCMECRQMNTLLCKSHLGPTILCQTCDLNLRTRKFGICIKCKQINTGQNWCQPCNSDRFRQNFSNWASNNDDVDKFIQNNQLSAKNKYQLLEWIPYDRFHDGVKYITKGGFGKIYKACWKDGYISHWNVIKHRWQRNNANKCVALKVLEKSQKLKSEFIDEITSHVKIIDRNTTNEIVRCYGISQDPSTNNYVMVMKYAENGSLRSSLDRRNIKHKPNFIKLSELKKRCSKLMHIASGIKRIHEKGLIHRDLHTGNIVCFVRGIGITDMGLCKPVNYEELENKVYGVLPYMAPEIIGGKIYSFGIIMYEIISETPPYPNINHDEHLAIDICEGLRPNFNIKVPQLIVHLIKRCLDVNPSNRPSAKDLSRTFHEWTTDFANYRNDRP